MSKENKILDKEENKNNFITDINDKSLNEIEYIEYISKKAKTVRSITYPDGSKGELYKGVVILL